MPGSLYMKGKFSEYLLEHKWTWMSYNVHPINRFPFESKPSDSHGISIKIITLPPESTLELEQKNDN